MPTIKTIIFDFGNVFINLDIQGTILRAKNAFGYDIITEEKKTSNPSIFKVNDNYEKGLITSKDFVSFYMNLSKNATQEHVIQLWNSLITDFPKHRFEFIQQLAKEKKYKLILLSNTNELHINSIKKTIPFYEAFKNCFDAFYLSHEIKLRKPNLDIYEFVLRENLLKAEECLFIDDTKANTDSANKIGFHTWNINPNCEDVTTLFTTKKELF